MRIYGYSLILRYMLTVAECRKILGEIDLTDEEIEQTRNALYTLCETLLNKHFKDLKRKP